MAVVLIKRLHYQQKGIALLETATVSQLVHDLRLEMSMMSPVQSAAVSAMDPATVSVDIYTATDPVTGNTVVFAQRYAADGKIGDPFQVTSSDVSADYFGAVTVLADGGFIFPYYYTDPNESYPLNVALEQVTKADIVISLSTLPYYDNPSYAAYALNNGAAAYITTINTGDDFPERIVNLGYTNASGEGFTSFLYDAAVQFGPYPYPVFGDVSVQQLPNDSFSVSYAETYTLPDPGFPDVTPGPSGSETFTRIYSDAGVLLLTSVMDFDNTTSIKNYNAAGTVIESETRNAAGQVVDVEGFDASGRRTVTTQRTYDSGGALIQRTSTVYDPADGAALQSSMVYADGSRTDTNDAVVGQPYATQTESYDAAGRTTMLTRTYGDAAHTVALSQVTSPDGSSEVHSYDKQGRETTRILTASDGSREVVNQTYSGTSGMPTTIADYRYFSGNQLLSVDTTNADKTHTQVAKVPGVELTSTSSVADTLVGAAAGATSFVFKPASGQDIVTNFQAGSDANHDVIDVSAFGLPVQPDQDSLYVLAHSLRQVGHDTILAITPSDTVTIKNTALASLTAADFKVG